jgi:MoxR-like ATPase
MQRPIVLTACAWFATNTCSGEVTSPLPHDSIAGALGEHGYFADEALVTALFLGLELGKPLLLEGAPGVGKTEVARTLASVLGRNLVRLQCYEGIDASKALYDWDHARQLLQVRVAERHGSIATSDLYAPEFLIEMPLLKALRNSSTSILLIDEIDRADDAFEAFLLEFLSDFQISIPEIGTVKADNPVVTILTSNRTRELHDALRRRCLYHCIDYPTVARERTIVERHAPGITSEAAEMLVDAVSGVRRLPLIKKPGISESIDWARAALALNSDGASWPDALKRSLGLLIKDQEDIAIVQQAAVI